MPRRRLADDGKRLGLSESALDVVFVHCFSERSWEGFGEGGLLVLPGFRLADDGKRLGLSESGDGRCIEKGLPRGGVWGGERAGFGRVGRLADSYFGFLK